MSSALTLITGALDLIGAHAVGESIPAAESQDALRRLNNMLAIWNNQRLAIYQILRNEYATVANTPSYTLGTSGTWSTTRPVRVTGVGVILANSGTPPAELPLTMLNDDQWRLLSPKTLTSAVPLSVYVDYGFPLLVVYVWPIVTGIQTIVLYSWNALASIAALATEISLPPGFDEAVEYNLACRLGPLYGIEIPAQVQRQAVDSLSWIKRQNRPAALMVCDPALRSTPGQLTRGQFFSGQI